MKKFCLRKVNIQDTQGWEFMKKFNYFKKNAFGNFHSRFFQLELWHLILNQIYGLFSIIFYKVRLTLLLMCKCNKIYLMCSRRLILCWVFKHKKVRFDWIFLFFCIPWIHLSKRMTLHCAQEIIQVTSFNFYLCKPWKNENRSFCEMCETFLPNFTWIKLKSCQTYLKPQKLSWRQVGLKESKLVRFVMPLLHSWWPLNSYFLHREYFEIWLGLANTYVNCFIPKFSRKLKSSQTKKLG